MAASSEYDIDFEELERLFIDDTTDEQFSFDEIEAISEPSLSGKDSFLSTNVSFSSLKLVLDRLADRQTNLLNKSGQLPRSLAKLTRLNLLSLSHQWLVCSSSVLAFDLRNKISICVQLNLKGILQNVAAKQIQLVKRGKISYCMLVSQNVLLLTMYTNIYSSISGLLLDLFSSKETYRDQLLRKLLMILWRLMRSGITRVGQ